MMSWILSYQSLYIQVLILSTSECDYVEIELL